jgi:hypothetical protein
MKIIITEEQNKSLISTLMNELFQGYELKFENEDRVVYVNNKPIIMLGPNKAIVDNEVLHELKKVLFFDSLKDVKESIREWIINTFGIKHRGGFFYGITFKNLSKQK